MSWILKEEGFNPDDIVKNGNKFLTGNGYIGCRGTLDEFGAKECVGLNIAGVYDGVEGKWRETINAFNPLYMGVYCKNIHLDARCDRVISRQIALDISCGIFRRRTVYKAEDGQIEVYSERFVSQADKNAVCSRTVIKSTVDTDILLKIGVDTEVWELNGPHYENVRTSADGKVITARGTTQEKKIPVTVNCSYSVPFENFKDGFAEIRVKLNAGKEFAIERICGIYAGELPKTCDKSYENMLSEHKKEWQKLWAVADVKIDGDDSAQFALRYSIYHLLILAPKGEYSIAARGLSGQTYKGAVFWDTEIFLLPFFMTVFPEKAKNLIKYRINTLPEARKKAKEYGFNGAFYAWESQDGYDACSDFNVVDVFTHRPVRTYFKDKQIHISADVAYAIIEYYGRTGDTCLMLGGGFETVLACAEFLRSYSYFNHIKGRFELLDVIGPDEYHERVNNNAYTNYMAHYVAAQAVALYEELKTQHFDAVQAVIAKFPAGIIENLKEWAEKLYLPAPDKDGVIEQFDGYFKLEDTTVQTVRSRLVDPNEYWGSSGGVATATRVIKQADVIMLFNLHPNLFGEDIQKANYDFYSAYTEHGSSLSHCAYALTACRVKENGGAWSAFLNSAEIDLKGGGKQWAGEIYIGGTHPAASGGAWMTAVYGFAGLNYNDGIMAFRPCLPKNIKSVSFTAYEKGVRYKVTVREKNVKKEKFDEV